jgi:hypothetical protein
MAQMVTLGCIAMKGRYPKLIAPGLPRGLKFINGVTSVTVEQFNHMVSTHSDFPIFLKKREIFKLNPKSKMPPNPNIPVVLRGEPASTLTMEPVDTTKPDSAEQDSPKNDPPIELDI